MFNIPLEVPLVGSEYIVILEGLGMSLIREGVLSINVKPKEL